MEGVYRRCHLKKGPVRIWCNADALKSHRSAGEVALPVILQITLQNSLKSHCISVILAIIRGYCREY